VRSGATDPHGEYLPWVQQACGLKERYARKLVQAAEWVNTQHAAGLDQITDATPEDVREWVEMSGRPEVLSGVQSLDTLFLLSADATPDDVREWVIGDLSRQGKIKLTT